MRIVWGVKDYSVRVPSGDSRVIVNSPDYLEVLSTARVLCYNHEVAEFLHPREGQQVVQTYHGHPFKMMGVGRWRALNFSNAQIQRSLAWREKWTLLLSPTPIATRLYRQNLPYPPKLQRSVTQGTTGSCSLITLNAWRFVRAWAFPHGKKVVLYAPTWRDYLASTPWSSRMVTFVNPTMLATALGDEYLVLLRAHPAHGRDNSYVLADDESRVIDVTYYPDVNDLLIAADIGVFDYSSVRFDFALTQKPMIFFVPDEEQFFESAPSLIPFDETAPGRQVASTDELIEAIMTAEIDRAEYAGPYEAFRQRFAGLDDGHAAERATSLILTRAGIVAATDAAIDPE